SLERLNIFHAADGRPFPSVSHPRDEFTSIFGVGPRATPAVGDNVVYTFGVTGRLNGLQIERKGGVVELFSLELLKDFKANNLRFGASASPLVEGDLMIAPVGAKGAGVVAVHRKTGATVWRALDDGASYASPIAIGEGAQRQIIVLTQHGIASLSPRDGAVFWQHPFKDRINESSTTPQKAGDLLIVSSVTLGTVALKLTDKRG